MRKRNIISVLTSLGAVCFAFVATVSAAAPCWLYFYQPKTPNDVKARLARLGMCR
jgi:cyclic lactone autoinducer peptide